MSVRGTDDQTRMRRAIRRGLLLACSFFAIGYAVSMLQPSTPPHWAFLFGGSLGFGALHESLVSLEVGPFEDR